MIYSKIGTHQTICGREIMVVERGAEGSVLYGPYLRLRPGRYSVAFRIEADEGASPDACCAIVDVVTDQGQTKVREMSLTPSQIARADGTIHVLFTAHDEGTFEFRVFASGACGLRVDVERAVTPISTDQPIPTGSISAKQLYEVNSHVLQSLERQGAVVTVRPEGGLRVELGDLRFNILNAEDCQVANEIHLRNDYNLHTPNDKLVVDVGMNAGLTALYFAAMHSVRSVHAFEPFRVPFRKAEENFALNPQQAAKIRAHPFGLSDKDGELEVLVSSEETVGTSIRGVLNGQPERIKLRRASDVIGPLAQEATASGFDLVVKMDCEGSEFAIFESLAQANLIGFVTVFVIEWHKWWSAQKTQADIIRPLMAAGFVVHDSTHPDDPYAGMLYAVRKSR